MYSFHVYFYIFLRGGMRGWRSSHECHSIADLKCLRMFLSFVRVPDYAQNLAHLSVHHSGDVCVRAFTISNAGDTIMSKRVGICGWTLIGMQSLHL